MENRNEAADYADWLADLADSGEELSGEALRSLLATRIKSMEKIELAAKEVEISRRIKTLMFNLQKAEITVPADFEARLMARVGDDETLLNLLEVYLNGFGQALIELINALFSFFPETETPPVVVGTATV